VVAFIFSKQCHSCSDLKNNMIGKKLAFKVLSL